MQPSSAAPHRLVLIADPQLVDPHTYPGRPWPLSSLTVSHTDLYLRRSFRMMHRYLRPDTVFFLGDLFDGGREWATPDSSSPESRYKGYGTDFWLNEYARFHHIFSTQWRDGDQGSVSEPRGRRMIASLPGNHDLGFATGIQGPVRDRFDAYFGPLNRLDIVGNHTFVSLDTVSLSAMDQADPVTGSSGEGDGTAATPGSELWGPAADFLDQVKYRKHRAIRTEMRQLAGMSEQAYVNFPLRGFAPNLTTLLPGPRGVPRRNDLFPHMDSSTFPTVLLTHVPLYRPSDTDCGVWRENSHAIRVERGYQYQNVLTPLVSKEIISKLGAEEVTQIYSGDDHDFCEVEHNEFTGRIKEITVKSMSWAMGVRRPGFLAVSLHNPVDLDSTSTPGGNLVEGTIPAAPNDTIQNHLCLLPDQLSIFIRYLVVLALTLLVLAVRAIAVTASRRSQSTASFAHHSSSSSSPLLPFFASPSPSDNKAHDRALPVSTSTSARHPTTTSPSTSRKTLPASAMTTTTTTYSSYGHIPPSSRSTSPAKSDRRHGDDSAALLFSTNSTTTPSVDATSTAVNTPAHPAHGHHDDDWGMPARKHRHQEQQQLNRSLAAEFAHGVWTVAWPSVAFWVCLVYYG